MIKIIKEYHNLAYTGKLRSNKFNSEYEIKQGTKVEIVSVEKDKENRNNLIGVKGFVDSPMNITINAVISLRNIEPKINNLSNVNLYTGDKIKIIDSKEIIIL